VIVIGTNLQEAMKVKFGTTEVSLPFIENTEMKIKVEAPEHAAGIFDVVVTTPVGTSAETPADEYIFVAAPAVTALSPTKGPSAGGNQVEITGVNLSGATEVEFGSTVVNAPFSENTETKIKVNAPAHAAGKVHVRVTTVGGTSSTAFSNDDYIFEGPAALTVNKAGTGSGSVTCNGGACALTYSFGTKVTLAASPSAGSTFIGWSGSGCSGTGACVVTMNAATAVTATFNANPSSLPPPPLVQCVVSKLKGLSLEKAKSAIAKAHCKVGKVGKPKAKKGKKLGPLVVKSSSPAAGAVKPEGTKVNLTLGPKPKKGKK
jgi:hypothetical protein